MIHNGIYTSKLCDISHLPSSAQGAISSKNNLLLFSSMFVSSKKPSIADDSPNALLHPQQLRSWLHYILLIHFLTFCHSLSTPGDCNLSHILWRVPRNRKHLILLCAFCSTKLFMVGKHRPPKEDSHQMAPFPASQSLWRALLSHWSYGAGVMALPVKSHYNYEKCLQLLPPYRQSLWLSQWAEI